MKIAVTYENGQVFGHFGRTEYFKVYDVENNAVQSSAVLDTNGSGHCALADFLKQNGVDTLICGGIGAGAKNALASAGIKLYGGAAGEADRAVADFLANRLDYNSGAECDHHHGGEGHDCHDGGHDCHSDCHHGN